MKTRFVLAALAASSLLGSPAFAQSSDIRQAEQDREAQRQRELRERPQYLPGDRRIVEEAQRQEAQRVENERREEQRRDEAARREEQRRQEAARRGRVEPPRYGDGRPVYRDDRDRAPVYRDDRRGEWRDSERRGDWRDGDRRGDWRSEWRESGRGAGPNRDWYRGNPLPRQYRGRAYVVDDWRGHRLYAPPRGHQWVQAGGDYVLVAITTGVIAAVLLSQ
jgi:Ni/Co efflux regulator RcnB